MSGAASRWLTAAIAVFLAAVLFVAFDATGSVGGFVAAVRNTSDTADAGALAYTHSYATSTCAASPSSPPPASCPGSLYPPTSAGSRLDAIHNDGTLSAPSVTERVQGASCAPVSLANNRDTGNVLLPRYGTTFGAVPAPMTGAGAITLDGATGYAASILAQNQPNPVISLGSSYGLGVWFKTTSSTGGPLFGFGDSPIATAGTNDRILYLNAAGRLGFGYNTGNSVLAPPTTGATYNDGAWHFAYVTMSTVTVIVSAITTITIDVDGTQTGTFSGLLTGLNSYAGYWHLGWSPLTAKSYGSGLSNYFGGSLSNFVVFNSGSAPAVQQPDSSTQAAFDTWAATATEQWRLADTGTTTFTGTLPSIGITSPCSFLDIAWSFTNATSCDAGCIPSTQLSAFCTAAWHIVTAPPAASTQAATITLTHDPTYASSTYPPGLILYAPLLIQFQVTGSSWTATFTWTNPSTPTTLGSTFTL